MSKRNGKRILSVTVRRMFDDSPDTSHMGEYANRPANEFAIDRAHSQDCESIRPPFESDGEWSAWNGTAEESLERVRTFLENYQANEDHWSSPNGCHEDCPACADEEPYNEAIETVWELEKHAGDCDCHGGDLGRNEYRYFNPSFNYVRKDGKPADGLTADEVRKYVRQDYDRMESLNAGDWCYIGIRAEAKVQVTGDTVQRISSGGLWGIESDSDRSYFDEVQKDELANLKTELLALGFSTRAIATAFKNVEEVSE